MAVLSENMVYSKTRTQDLRNVKQLNCWGSELTDVSIVRNMPFVQVLSLSVNSISSLADFACCKNLQELYLRDNKIKDLDQVLHLQELPNLKKLWLAGNPCSDKPNYRQIVLRILPNLQFLDNIPVTQEEVAHAESCASDASEDSPADVKSEGRDEEEYEDEDEVPTHHPASSSGTTPKPAGLQTPVGPQAPSSASSSGPRVPRVIHSESHSGWSTPHVAPVQTRQAPAHLVTPMGQGQGTQITRSVSVADYTILNGAGAVASGVPHVQPEIQMGGYSNGSTPKTAPFPSQVESQRKSYLPKGGKNRNANILSAVLCLLKELDSASLEVVDTEIHCRMEEMMGN